MLQTRHAWPLSGSDHTELNHVVEVVLQAHATSVQILHECMMYCAPNRKGNSVLSLSCTQALHNRGAVCSI